MLKLFLLQVTDSAALAANTISNTGDTVEKLSILELLAKGGWAFMIPLLILSIIAIYIFIDRFIKIRNAGRVDDNFISRIREYMLMGNMTAAQALCRDKNTPIARMVEKGISRIGKPLSSIRVAIENEGKLELLQLEKNLATLATIAGAAPMIGFLGTVTGMIQAFYKLSTLTAAGGKVDPGMLAGGIYQALVTTAAGLTIGIIAFICYNFLVAQVEKVVYKMEATTVQFIDFLQEPAKIMEKA